MRKGIILAGFIGSNFVRYFKEKYPHYNLYALDKLTYAGNIEKKVKKELIEYYEYAESEAEELLKSAKYDFKGWDIKVDIPQLENFRYTMHLSAFDKSMLNIFDKED